MSSPGDGVSIESGVQRLEAEWWQPHPAIVGNGFIHDFGFCSASPFLAHFLTLELAFSVIPGMTQSLLINFFSVSISQSLFPLLATVSSDG